MDYEDKLEICYKEFAEEFGITEKQAKRIINNFDLEDIMIEYYRAEIRQAQEVIDYEVEQNKQHYNDGWNQHIGG